jgi:NodT family efflux transporter outer membrane factor (OMF) lipoprotein
MRRGGYIERLLASAAAAGLLCSCAVGPDFGAPKAPETPGYSPEPLPAATAASDVSGGEAQRFASGAPVPERWWHLFRSPALDALIERALTANSDLAAAQAALRAAQELVIAQEGAFWPSVTGSFSPSRNKTATGALAPASASGNPYYTLNTGQVGASWAPDIFGLNRRTVESLKAQADAQRFLVEATYLTLTANLASAAVQEASLRGQIAATEDVVKVETELLGLLRKQFQLGAIPEASVIAQESVLGQVEATLPPLKRQLAQQRDLLTALSGRLPADPPPESFELSAMELPQDLPVSLPARLVEQRPDVRQAQENLHSASALIGVAIANRLPNLTLSASGGGASSTIGGLTGPGTAFWSIAASLTQPLFDAGTLLHKERAAEATYEQAAAQYRTVVVTAFQNVADALRALQNDADAVAADLKAERSARESLEIARRQMQLGDVSYLALLNAEQLYQQTVIALIQARAARFADTVSLFQALGGGWRMPPEEQSPAAERKQPGQ